MIGVVWALIGYVACEVTNRGRITTTVITAIAGAAGLGRGLVGHASATAAPTGLLAGAALVLVLALAGAVALAFRGRRTGRHRHGSAAIASTRYVRYTERKGDAVHRGAARPDRTRRYRPGE